MNSRNSSTTGRPLKAPPERDARPPAVTVCRQKVPSARKLLPAHQHEPATQ